MAPETTKKCPILYERTNLEYYGLKDWIYSLSQPPLPMSTYISDYSDFTNELLPWVFSSMQKIKNNEKKKTLNYPPHSEMDGRDFGRAFMSRLVSWWKFRLLLGIFYGLTFEAVLKIDKGKLDMFLF